MPFIALELWVVALAPTLQPHNHGDNSLFKE